MTPTFTLFTPAAARRVARLMGVELDDLCQDERLALLESGGDVGEARKSLAGRIRLARVEASRSRWGGDVEEVVAEEEELPFHRVAVADREVEAVLDLIRDGCAALAAALGVSDRRARQLIEQIAALPAPLARGKIRQLARRVRAGKAGVVVWRQAELFEEGGV